MQERRNSIANALELRLSCTNPSIRDLTVIASAPAGGAVLTFVGGGFQWYWYRQDIVITLHILHFPRGCALNPLLHLKLEGLSGIRGVPAVTLQNANHADIMTHLMNSSTFRHQYDMKELSTHTIQKWQDFIQGWKFLSRLMTEFFYTVDHHIVNYFDNSKPNSTKTLPQPILTFYQ